MITIESRLLAELHPTVVHWPLTLAGLALAADLLAWRSGGAPWARAGWILLWLLGGAMVLGDLTGFLATVLLTLPPALVGKVWVVGAFALAATAAGLSALALRRRPGGAPTPASTLCLAATLVLLGLGDHAGFGLIRTYGLGTRPGYPSATAISLPPGLLADLFGALALGGLIAYLVARPPGRGWRLSERVLEAAARPLGKKARGRP